MLRLAGNEINSELDAMKFEWLTGRISEAEFADRREDFLRRAAPNLTASQLATVRGS